jgi:hypothetical protein
MSPLPADAALPPLTLVELHRELLSIHRLLSAHDEDFASLRQMQREWLQFQSTLSRLVHLIDGNGRPPVSERILVLEEQARRWSQMDEQMETVKFRLIGLLIGVTLSLLAALFTLLRS